MFREELFKHDSSTYSSWHVALWFFRHIVGHLWWHVGSFDARVGYPHSQWLLMYCLNYALEFSLTVSTRLWLWPCHCSMVCRLFLRHTSCANAVREFKCWVASNGGHLWQQTQRSSLFGCVCVCVCVLEIREAVDRRSVCLHPYVGCEIKSSTQTPHSIKVHSPLPSPTPHNHFNCS